MTLEPEPSPCCAAIVYGDDFNANAVLEEFATALNLAGWRAAGLIQRRAQGDRPCAGDVFLIDTTGSRDFRISQKLGPESTCCSVDPGGIADASLVLRQAMETPLDLLIVNKFGKLEAEGGGFIAEIMDAVAQGISVLTTVHAKHLDRWHQFTGELGETLPADVSGVARWWRQRAGGKGAIQKSS